MEKLFGYGFRFLFYMFFGLSLETIFSVLGIEAMLGRPVPRRVPKKYLEGFVSLYMIPLHGFALLFLYEPVYQWVKGFFILWRFFIWAIGITSMEAAWGFLLDKVLGFYPWDYYADSRFKVFRRGYTLWTLIPMWGLAGLFLEFYSQLLIRLTPEAVRFIRVFFNLRWS